MYLHEKGVDVGRVGVVYRQRVYVFVNVLSKLFRELGLWFSVCIYLFMVFEWPDRTLLTHTSPLDELFLDYRQMISILYPDFVSGRVSNGCLNENACSKLRMLVFDVQVASQVAESSVNSRHTAVSDSYFTNCISSNHYTLSICNLITHFDNMNGFMLRVSEWLQLNSLVARPLVIQQRLDLTIDLVQQLHFLLTHLAHKIFPEVRIQPHSLFWLKFMSQPLLHTFPVAKSGCAFAYLDHGILYRSFSCDADPAWMSVDCVWFALS